MRRRGLLILLAAAAVTLGLVLWLARGDSDDAGPAASDRRTADGGTGSSPGLLPAGASPRQPRREEEAGAAQEAGAPAPKAPDPDAAGTAASTPPPSVLDLRLQREQPDGTVEAVAPTQVYRHGGASWWERAPTVQGGLAVRPGEMIAVGLEVPAAMSEWIRVRIPDPVPRVMTVPVFAADDARFQEMLVEVVDAFTGAPLPDAVLEWTLLDAPATQAADHRGRILVRAAPGTGDSLALLLLQDDGFCIHAPGYRPHPETRGEAPGPSIDAAELAAWCESGIHRVALRPRADQGAATERTVRILDADGRALVGARVLVRFAVPREAAVAFLADARDGFRRTDAHGEIRVPVPRVVGLEVRIHDVPVEAWGLSEDAWPATGPREIRLPAIADAEVVINQAPGRSGSWRCDPLGPRRTWADGPAVTPRLDSGAAALLAKRDAILPVRMEEARGNLPAKKAVIRLPLVVGRPQTLYLRMESHEKTWTVTPDRKGRWRATARWADLPDA